MFLRGWTEKHLVQNMMHVLRESSFLVSTPWQREYWLSWNSVGQNHRWWSRVLASIYGWPLSLPQFSQRGNWSFRFRVYFTGMGPKGKIKYLLRLEDTVCTASDLGAYIYICYGLITCIVSKVGLQNTRALLTFLFSFRYVKPVSRTLEPVLALEHSLSHGPS